MARFIQETINGKSTDDRNIIAAIVSKEREGMYKLGKKDGIAIIRLLHI